MAAQRRSSSKSTFFDAASVAAHLETVKNAACAALEPGQTADDIRWWDGVLFLEWATPHKANNTQWVNISYKDEHGIKGRLVLRIRDELHVGQIMPSTEEGVAELAAQARTPQAAGKIELRQKKPQIQIQKWKVPVPTEDDGVTILCDEHGEPLLPGDEHLSAYYRVAACLHEVFCAETNKRIERGAALVAKAVEMLKKDKKVTAQAILAAFAAEYGPRAPGDMILTTASLARVSLRPPEMDLLARGAFIVSNAEVRDFVQTKIGRNAKNNAGYLLPNPMTRFTVGFGATFRDHTDFFDKTKPYLDANGRQMYEAGQVDGAPVCDANLHKFIPPKAAIDGIVAADSICMSSMGISMPAKITIAVVEAPAAGRRGMTLDDVYDFEAPAPATAPATMPASAPTTAPATTPASDSIDDICTELTGGW
jgi:hypothetical protein